MGATNRWTPNTPNNLNLISWNCRGIKARDSDLRELLDQYQPDVLLLQETLLKHPKQVNFKNYISHFPATPAKESTQGVAIFAKKNIAHCNFHFTPVPGIELVAITIKIGSKSTNIYSSYISPKSKIEFKELKDVFNHKFSILCGDFNAKNTTWGCRASNRRGQGLHRFTTQNGIQVLAPPRPTYYQPQEKCRPDILDIALHHSGINIHSIECLPDFGSDHRPIKIKIRDKIRRINTKTFNYNKADWDLFQAQIEDELSDKNNTIPPTPELLDAEASHFHDLIKIASTNSIPKKSFQYNGKTLPPEILSEIKHKRFLRRKFYSDRTSANKNELNKQCKLVTNLIQVHGKRTFAANLELQAAEEHGIWKAIAKIKYKPAKPHPIHGRSGLVYDEDEKADALADALEETLTPPTDIPTHTWDAIHRTQPTQPEATSASTPTLKTLEVMDIIRKLKPRKAPGPDEIQNIILQKLPEIAFYRLTQLFNSSLRIGHVPEIWKLANIVMLPKPGKDPLFPTNYRPISLLNSIGKVLEKLVCKRAQNFLTENNVIPDEQFGFRGKHATTHQLMRIVEYASLAYNRKEITGAVFMDISKAFDKVWHPGLLFKLRKVNIPHYLYNWLESFLKGRQFRIKINDTFSSFRPITAGVPQGSILSPMLFNVYTYDIPKVPRGELALYADDTTIFAKSMNLTQLVKYLQEGLDLYSNWARDWGISVNPSKSQAMLFTNKMQRNPTVKFQGANLPWQKEVKYLGVILDRTLSWGPNTTNSIKKAKAALSAITPILKTLPDTNIPLKKAKMLYYAYVRSHLEYCAPVWCQCADWNIKRLQVVQNRALRMIYKPPRYTKTLKLHEDTNTALLKDRYKLLTKTFHDRVKQVDNPLIQLLGTYQVVQDPRKRMPLHALT